MDLRLVCISDTHSRHSDLRLPEGDVLVHCGDMSRRGTVAEIEDFGRYLATLPHAHKVVVAGNHDFLFQTDPEEARALLGDVTYLCDETAEVAGLTLFGSPWQPWFHDWAFNLPRGPELAERWAAIPTGTDVLVTHGPPFAVLDRVHFGDHVGCEELALAVPRIVPGLHVFGHIHESRGALERDGTLYVNASNCDRSNRLVHPPIVIDWTSSGPRIVAGLEAERE